MLKRHLPEYIFEGKAKGITIKLDMGSKKKRESMKFIKFFLLKNCKWFCYLQRQERLEKEKGTNKEFSSIPSVCSVY